MKSLKGTLGSNILPNKIALPQTEKNVQMVETVAKLLDEKEEERAKRITLDVPMTLYPNLKNHVFTKGITLKTYILELIEADLKGA